MIRLGLLGDPLTGSLSPRLHQAALSAAGLAGEYRLYPGPEAVVLARLADLRCGDLTGLNVTLPHKRLAWTLADRLTPLAARIGAVNTLARDGALLVGANTDAAGFQADLTRLGWAAPAGVARLLGAGGSARAVAVALLDLGWRVEIAARRVDAAAALAAELGPSCRAVPLTTSGAVDLLVNATPVGMHPGPDVSPWPEGVPLPAPRVYDLIYKPRATRLLRQAAAQGLGTADGLGMLVEQAALAFEIWTGVAASRPALWAAVAQEEKP